MSLIHGFNQFSGLQEGRSGISLGSQAGLNTYTEGLSSHVLLRWLEDKNIPLYSVEIISGEVYLTRQCPGLYF